VAGQRLYIRIVSTREDETAIDGYVVCREGIVSLSAKWRTMKRHRICIMFWLLVSAGWHTACQGHPIDTYPSELIFFGTVRNRAGSGVGATVEIQQRYGCDSSNIPISSSVESGADGSYELRQPLEGLDNRCFVVFAFSTEAPLLVSDTMRIPGSELDRLGNVLDDGRIRLDIEVR